ncbi:MAG: hypothetical protein HS117_08985 [Verrucomicrobiaceae bacterium]|jgi:hypothetical protein|nr:hypothetical protein [Verrucomicrobiaceae bacterium]
MKRLLFAALGLLAVGNAAAQLAKPRPSTLPQEPGTFSVEGLTPKPILVRIQAETPVYTTNKFERAIGSFAPGVPVTLVAMSDTAYRVRGRARHADVAGWVKQADVLSRDPMLADKLKKLFERTQQVAELIKNNQVALGMTSEEVQASLGRPTRTSAKINAAGKQERLEYAMFEKVPQVTTTRDAFGQLVQTVIYVKVEVGTLALSFKDGVVDEIEETKGNPLGAGGVKMVPVPIVF